jgi:hypothetical protein
MVTLGVALDRTTLASTYPWQEVEEGDLGSGVGLTRGRRSRKVTLGVALDLPVAGGRGR